MRVFEHKYRKNPHGINRIPVRNEGCRSPSAELVRTIQHHRHPLINAVVISMFAKLEFFTAPGVSLVEVKGTSEFHVLASAEDCSIIKRLPVGIILKLFG